MSTPNLTLPCAVPALPDVKENDELDEVMTVPIQFPEGGRAAWCMVIGAFLVQFCVFGYVASFGVYQDFYTRQYLTNESSSAISWIGSINPFLITSLGLVAGALYDRGYFYHLLIGGSLLESLTLFMLSLAQPGQYYQGVGLGLAQGLLYVPVMTVVSQYFSKRLTLAMSLVSCGSSFGSVIHPIMLNNLFGRVGFANGVRISAGFASTLLFIAFFLIRTRLVPPQHPVNYLSVGKGIVHDPPFCIMTVGLICFQTGLFFPFYYLQLDSIIHKNPEMFSFYSVVILNAGTMIGQLSTGLIAPHVGVSRLMILSTGACAIINLGMIGLNGISSVVVLGAIYGYFAGVYIAVLTPLMALLTSDLSKLGVRIGIGMTAVGIGSLIGTPISGALLTARYKWWQPALFSGLIALTGCFFMVMMELLLIHRRRSEQSRESKGQEYDKSVSAEEEK